MLNWKAELFTALAEKDIGLWRLLIENPLRPSMKARVEAGKLTGAFKKEAVAELNYSTPAW